MNRRIKDVPKIVAYRTCMGSGKVKMNKKLG
jgi:hypothetical protein